MQKASNPLYNAAIGNAELTPDGHHAIELSSPGQSNSRSTLLNPAGGMRARSHSGKKQPIRLTFEDVHFRVTIPSTKQEKHILKGISGELLSGEVVALMGSSGAGKTTLLNYLAGITYEGYSGAVKLNGEDRDNRAFRKISRYVMQEDISIPVLTVKESTQYAAELSLSPEYSAAEKQNEVDETLDELGLGHIADSPVGSADTERGISGGQRRRLSVAMEMVSHPRLLFLDEPTSGLDSHSAYHLIATLKDLAIKRQCIIVCTIHQPSTSTFLLFDKLMVLHGGQLAYWGSSKDVVQVMSNIGYTCPQYYNPAEFLIETISDTEKGERMVQHASKALQPNTGVNGSYEGGQSIQDVHLAHGRYNTSFMQQVLILWRRCMKVAIRNKLVFYVRVGATIVLATIIGTLYLRLGHDQVALDDRAGSLFINLMLISLLSIMPTVLTFPVEKISFFREHMNSRYGVMTYYISKVLSELPILSALTFAYAILTWSFIGYASGAAHFFIYAGVAILHSLVSQSIGFAVSIFAPNLAIAVFAAPLVAIPPYLFCGYLIQISSIGPWYRWMQWVSTIRYAFGALVKNEFNEAVFYCYQSPTVGENAAILFVWYGIFLCISYVFLRHKVKHHK